MRTAVRVVDQTRFTTGERQALFSAAPYEASISHQEYDVTPDDSKFLMIREATTLENTRIEHIWVRNWFVELRAKMRGT